MHYIPDLIPCFFVVHCYSFRSSIDIMEIDSRDIAGSARFRSVCSIIETS